MADSDRTMASTSGAAAVSGRSAARATRGTRTLTGPMSVSTVLVGCRYGCSRCPTCRVVLVVTDVVGNFTVQRRLQDALGQLQQPTLSGQRQPVTTSPIDQHRNQLLVNAPTGSTAGSCPEVISVVIWRRSLDRSISRYLYSSMIRWPVSSGRDRSATGSIRLTVEIWAVHVIHDMPARWGLLLSAGLVRHGWRGVLTPQPS